MVFVEGSIHKFQYPWNSTFRYELLVKKGNIMTTNFEPHECIIFLQSTKIGSHENKAIHNIIHLIKLIHILFIYVKLF